MSHHSRVRRNSAGHVDHRPSYAQAATLTITDFRLPPAGALRYSPLPLSPPSVSTPVSAVTDSSRSPSAANSSTNLTNLVVTTAASENKWQPILSSRGQTPAPNDLARASSPPTPSASKGEHMGLMADDQSRSYEEKYTQLEPLVHPAGPGAGLLHYLGIDKLLPAVGEEAKDGVKAWFKHERYEHDGKVRYVYYSSTENDEDTVEREIETHKKKVVEREKRRGTKEVDFVRIRRDKTGREEVEERVYKYLHH